MNSLLNEARAYFALTKFREATPCSL